MLSLDDLFSMYSVTQIAWLPDASYLPTLGAKRVKCESEGDSVAVPWPKLY